MTDSANEDSVTKLNTQLNKSMVLMEDAVDMPSPNNKRKSIMINTETQPSRTTSTPVKSRRSILKKSVKSSSKDATDDEVVRTNGDIDKLNETVFNGLSSPTSVLSRPRTVSGSFISF